MRLVLFACCFLMWPGVASASAAALSDITLNDLASNATWQRLTGFSGRYSDFSPRSDIANKDYFLSENGRNAPVDELIATIDALNADAPEDHNEHAACMFPARRLWLEQKLAGRIKIPPLTCTEFKDWRGDVAPNEISIIFASGFLGNPGSFFGHFLLKFGIPDEANITRSELLDTTINHGASYAEAENQLLYIIRGLTGRYEASYTKLLFHQQRRRYNELELRDVWVYTLNLTQREVDFVVAFAWERSRAHHRYYFFDQNCAFRITELVELIADGKITPKRKPWILPSDVLSRLAHAQKNGRALLRSVERLPSRQTLFREAFYELEPAEQEAVKLIVSGRRADQLEELEDLPEESTIRVLDTAINYADFSADDGVLQSGVKRIDLLAERIALPPSQTTSKRADLKKPHQGQKSSMLQLSSGYHDTFGAGARIRFRAAYYDYLSMSAAVLPNSELAFLDASFEVYDGNFSVQRIDFVNLQTLNVSPTGVPGDGGLAWGFRMGFEEENILCRNCLQGFLEGNVGKAAQSFSGQLTQYALLQGRVNTNADTNGIVNLGAGAGAIIDLSKAVRAHASIGFYTDVSDDLALYPHAKLDARYGVSDAWDIRITSTYERVDGEDTFQALLGVGLYF